MTWKSAGMAFCLGLVLSHRVAAEPSPDLKAASGSPLYLNGRSFQVLNSGRNSFQFSAVSCRALQAPAASLLAWKRGGAADESESFDCRCGGGQCRLDATELLPEFVRTTLGQVAFKANCFNTALVGIGLASEIEFTRFYEFSNILRRRCAQVRTPAPEDLGVVTLKGNALSPVHSFIFLTPEFGYEKPGSDQSEPWRFMNPSEEVGGTASPYPKESNDLVYFRCR